MHMKIAYLFIFFLFCCAAASAQTKTVTGTITGETGEVLSGASVVGKGTTIAAVTNATGNFSIVVPGKTRALVISYVGMEDQEVDITGKTNVTASLKVSRTNLNDVVVIGYGTVRKKDLTGSVVSLKGAEL